MRYPAELYTSPARDYQALRRLEYPRHDQTITAMQCGRLCFSGRKINLSVVFAGEYVGVREVADHFWLVGFMQYDLGFFDYRNVAWNARRIPSTLWRARRDSNSRPPWFVGSFG
jgi:hypothetical protein